MADLPKAVIRRRQPSADLVPKLDLSKTEQFACLDYPYAYLVD